MSPNPSPPTLTAVTSSAVTCRRGCDPLTQSHAWLGTTPVIMCPPPRRVILTWERHPRVCTTRRRRGVVNTYALYGAAVNVGGAGSGHWDPALPDGVTYTQVSTNSGQRCLAPFRRHSCRRQCAQLHTDRIPGAGRRGDLHQVAAGEGHTVCAQRSPPRP